MWCQRGNRNRIGIDRTDRTGWIHLTWIWMCSGSASWEFPSNVFFLFLFLFCFFFSLSNLQSLITHMHLVYTRLCICPSTTTTTTTMPPLCSASTTTTTSCNPTCCQTIIKILLDACWTLNNGSKCTHPPLSLFSPYLSLSPNAPPTPPTTTTTMRRTDSKARHSRWCWWSLNIPLRRHSPSQMFVTIFSFVFYFPYIFMFRANWNNYPFFQNQKTTTLLYCQYNFELAKFSFIIS